MLICLRFFPLLPSPFTRQDLLFFPDFSRFKNTYSTHPFSHPSSVYRLLGRKQALPRTPTHPHTPTHTHASAHSHSIHTQTPFTPPAFSSSQPSLHTLISPPPTVLLTSPLPTPFDVLIWWFSHCSALSKGIPRASA